jgi:hypothetical protein
MLGREHEEPVWMIGICTSRCVSSVTRLSLILTKATISRGVSREIIPHGPRDVPQGQITQFKNAR